MTDDEKWEFIKREVDKIHKIDEELSEVMCFLNLPCNSVLLNPAYKLMYTAVKAMDMMLDDNDHYWIYWFIYENDFGKKELVARKEGTDYITVKSVDDLRKVVTATHEEGGDNGNAK